jgi:hypothetical protein
VTSLRLRLLCVMLLLTTIPPALSANVDNPIGHGQFSMVGSGQLTWWGMTVYDAALYAPEGTYRPEHPHYLEITYRFSFTQEQLASRSLEEIERLHGKRSNREAVLAQFRSVFPDVAEGDRIVALHHPGKGVEFFRGEIALGRIDNATLAANFFSIWLDPETSKPDLRVRLLGIRTVSIGHK